MFSMKNKEAEPVTYLTHRVLFDRVKNEFDHWLDPLNGIIKAMAEMK